MLTNVYIIRKDLDKFFVFDPENDNWEWSKNLDDATIYQTPTQAEETIRTQKTGIESYVYEIPYSITQPQPRRKRLSKKPKRKLPKGKVIKKGQGRKK